MEPNDKDYIVIDIREGKEHELYIQQDVSDSRTLMYPAYAAARKALRGIVGSTSRWHRSHSGGRNSMTRGLDLYGFANNIMIFSAERGQGKTSAMLSFTGALAFETTPEISDEDDNFRVGDFFLQERKNSNRFYVLPPIDPTMLGHDENIVCIILSKLYQEINEAWNSTNHDFNGRGQDKMFRSSLGREKNFMGILEEIQKCFDCLGDYSGRSVKRHSNLNEDEFDNMLLLGDAFNLKEMLCDIISFFFTLKGNLWPNEKSFLVVQLDDTDLQFENAYSVLEDVRKYLSIPNVIVVMAGDIEQLSDILRQHYRDSSRQLSYEKVNNMTTKYMNKLFPSSQRIYLPTMEDQREIGKELRIDIIRDDSEFSRKYSHQLDPNGTEDLEIKFLEEIYRKTGVVFLKNDSGLHQFIPVTLREMQELHRLLYGMSVDMVHFLKSVDGLQEINDEIRKRMINSLSDQRENICKFENYFIFDWCSSKLDSDSREILCGVDKLAPKDKFEYVWDRIQSKFKGSFFAHPDDSAYSDQTQDDYLSYGYNGGNGGDGGDGNGDGDGDLVVDEVKGYVDLMRKLSSVSFNFTSERDYYLLFAVRTYFTIQFLKNSVSDEFRSISEWKIGSDFYFTTLYKDLFFFSSGEEFDAKNQNSLIDSYNNFGKDLSFYLSGRKEKSDSCSQDASIDEFTLLDDLMALLFSDLSLFNSRKGQLQYDILVLQRLLVYICFDGDIQNHFIRALTVLRDGEKCFSDEYSLEMLRALFDQINSSVGDQLDIYIGGSSNSLLNIRPFEILDEFAVQSRDSAL